ncbi:glycosyltransferase family 2 protein [Marinobacter sp. NFXS11]|uniref:glycosyltransferase family 2 protein n=1 Tax=Marinobacter sp. NFXS11 TaxID=2818432 RepID=UPI0032DFC6EB
MSAILIATIVCFLVPAYVYIGYPLLLGVLSSLKRSETIALQTDSELPSVTLIISCFNEADVIEEKLRNALELDYPKDRLSVLVVSDGSTDGTDEIVKRFAGKSVQLIRQEGRLGKTMGLNLAMESVVSDITVFSDANAMYAPDAARLLVRHFQKPDVGYVVGAALYTDGDAGASAQNEGVYWRYELAIKTMESRLSSVVGGDGAIYAIRSSLWQPLDRKDINDFVNPLQIVLKGYRGVFEPQAQCFEETAGEFDKEIARKERIVNRSIRGLFRVRGVMNPLRTGLFSFMVISHKLLRWLIPLFLAFGGFGSLVLSFYGLVVFKIIALGGLLTLGLAAIGHLSSNKNVLPIWISFPYYFIAVNWYAVRGIIRAIQGETQVTWDSARPGRDGR